MTEKWVNEVEEVIAQMSHADVGYYSDHVWCGNENVEAWFYPDGTCLVSLDGDIKSLKTKVADSLLVEQPPEELLKQCRL